MYATQLIDGGLKAVITTFSLTSNVITITTNAAHGFVVGQIVDIAFNSNDANYSAVSFSNGKYAVASCPSPTTFTVAKTHADVGSTTVGGVVMAYNKSPMPDASTTIALVSPHRAKSLTIQAGAAGMTLQASSAGTLNQTLLSNGTYPLPNGADFTLAAQPGVTYYVARSSGTVNFLFITEL